MKQEREAQDCFSIWVSVEGKTAVVLQALSDEHLPALVLAPKRVAEEVWHAERDKWRPDLSLARAVGTPLQRQKARDLKADVTVMSRDTIGDIAGQKHPYKTIILDELSGYKTRGTTRWKASRKITATASHVWGLTGTPAPNGYIDLWAQVYMLDKGKRLGTTLTAYRDRYFDAGRRMPITNIVTRWDPKPGAVDAINELLEDLCLSMKSEDYLDLPDITLNEIAVPLPASARKIYDKMKEDLVADLTLLGGSVHTAANAAVLSGRLRQATAGFFYDDGDTSNWTTIHDERIKIVREIIDGTGSPVLVFYQFEAEKQALLKELKEARTVNSPNVFTDWDAGKVPVLVAHPASIGHGLNLQHGGYTAVWSSLTWSLEEWEQSNKRLHRQGQKNTVVVHVLISPNTVDRSVYTSLSNKTLVQDGLMDYLTEDARMLR